MSIYDTLNEQQKLGVITTEGPVLILAGAGSGKTRVLTHRTAYLIEEKGVNPYNIMAITFTNKAAGEMRERIDALVGYGSESIWVSTFHSTCVRILRRHIDRIGYDTNFTIYDSDDSKSVMKEICKRLNIDTKIYKERSLLAAISSAKDELVSPTQFALQAAASSDFAKKKQAQVYQEYQAALQKNNALDFDDLIVKTVELLQTDPEVLAYYQERFRYIMVDEYQDTNTAQFELIRLLAGKYKNLCVVGDDDQSIYKFRGANIYNILNFEKHFPDAIIGHSDHTPDLYTSFGAVTLGARIIEKHVILDKRTPGPDQSVSIDFQELHQLVDGIRKLEDALGSVKKVHPGEEETRSWAFRSLVTKRPIKKGQRIEEDMIWSKRPGTGIPAYRMKEIIGKYAAADIDENVLLKEDDFC